MLLFSLPCYVFTSILWPVLPSASIQALFVLLTTKILLSQSRGCIMTESICACCGKDLPNNPTVCPRCDEVPTELESYTEGLWCNEYCKDRDAKKHAPRCRERTQLRSFLRAANLLQDLFFVFREASFSRPITSVSFENMHTPGGPTNDVLSFQQAGYNDVAPIRPDSPVYRLPECLSGESENVKQYRQSILAFLCCDESLIWMYRLIKWALLDTRKPAPRQPKHTNSD